MGQVHGRFATCPTWATMTRIPASAVVVDGAVEASFAYVHDVSPGGGAGAVDVGGAVDP